MRPLVVPCGIYSDKGSGSLRKLFLERSAWRWLYGFINSRRIFDIHSSFKFCIVIVEKGASANAMRTAFMRHTLEDWSEARGGLVYPVERIRAFSPKSLSIVEIKSERDLAILTKIYSASVLLGDEGPHGWGITYAREFDTTTDSKLFVARDKAEDEGFRADDYGRWIGPSGEVLLPLYEGRMIGQFDFSQKGWVSGRGRGAIWEEIPFSCKRIRPQFLLDAAKAAAEKLKPGPKVAYMRIGSATNARTVFSTYLRDTPAADSVFYFLPDPESPFADSTAAAVVGVFGTFAYDWTVRARIGGLNLSEFLMVETPLPRRGEVGRWLQRLVVRLGCGAPQFAPEWLSLVGRQQTPWRKLWACTTAERTRLRCLLDALIAATYGLAAEELAWVLKDCDQPRERLADKAYCRRLDPKGFWRVDRALDPELRQSVLSQVAFADLCEHVAKSGGDREDGIGSFLTQNGGEGWLLPETIRLADYGLGHDHRAQEPQPVASRLGERFYDWQLAQAPEQSWDECEHHARVLLGEAEFARRFDRDRASPPAQSSGKAKTRADYTLFPEAEA